MTVLSSSNEVYQITFHKKLYAGRKKLYGGLGELQKDLDDWMERYNNKRTHQDKVCCDRAPMGTLLDGKSIWAERTWLKSKLTGTNKSG